MEIDKVTAALQLFRWPGGLSRQMQGIFIALTYCVLNFQKTHNM